MHITFKAAIFFKNITTMNNQFDQIHSLNSDLSDSDSQNSLDSLAQTSNANYSDQEIQSNQEPEVLEEELRQIVFNNYYGSFFEYMSQSKRYNAIKNANTPQQKLAIVINLTQYLKTLQCQEQQNRLFYSTNLIDILNQALDKSMGDQLRFQTFKLFATIANVDRFQLYVLFQKLIIKYLGVSQEIIVEMLSFKSKTTNQAAIYILGLILNHQQHKSCIVYQFLLKNHLIQVIDSLIKQKEMFSMQQRLGQMIAVLLRRQFVPIHPQISQATFGVVFQLILNSKQVCQQQAAVKNLIGALTTYLDRRYPKFMLKYQQKIYEILRSIKNHSSEFIQLLRWSVQYYGISKIKLDQFMETLEFYAQNQQRKNHTKIYNLAALLQKNFDKLSKNSQNHLKSILLDAIQSEIPERQTSQFVVIQLYLQAMPFRRQILEPRYFSKMIRNLISIHNSNKKSSILVLHALRNVIIRELFNFYNQREQRILNESQQSEKIQRVFKDLGAGNVRSLIFRCLKKVVPQYRKK